MGVRGRGGGKGEGERGLRDGRPGSGGLLGAGAVAAFDGEAGCEGGEAGDEDGDLHFEG